METPGKFLERRTVFVSRVYLLGFAWSFPLSYVSFSLSLSLFEREGNFEIELKNGWAQRMSFATHQPPNPVRRSGNFPGISIFRTLLPFSQTFFFFTKMKCSIGKKIEISRKIPGTPYGVCQSCLPAWFCLNLPVVLRFFSLSLSLSLSLRLLWKILASKILKLNCKMAGHMKCRLR